MINISEMNSNDCCGCRTCEQLCSQKSISFINDKEGFLVPHIEKKSCINCGLCVKKCPQLNSPQLNNSIKVLAVKYNDDDILIQSSSGGVFVGCAGFVLENGGIVYGCAFDSNMVAKNIRINDKNQLCKLQGSKYVQSDTENTFSQAKKDLISGYFVLYSGTPCQIGGLLSYLGKEYDNLLTIEILCHGVPSPLLFKKYVIWLERKLGEKLISYNFRTKEKYSWGVTKKAKVKTENKEKYLTSTLDPYYSSFMSAKTLRESCYNCYYAGNKRVGDISIGDYWGILKEHKEFYSEKGVSLTLINSVKGKQFFENIQSNFDYIESSIQKASKYNRTLIKPTKRPIERDIIYKDLDSDGYFDKKLRVKLQLSDILKSIIPYKIKVILKKRF
jgi:coenzyme F420-reducing hydrogenase beta subunit